uniref:Mitogen-activated protein kinase n=1 Tax=Rhizochromulina marina TaxID=1034831 RepID=A0A7S2RGM5_9STRA|mmetsp:Transcript_15949/g.46843  ORF Transcript_15949/g.46843 Transcript_15949/m.46843 type:complete len:556 (+) Transcript_15949:41-1708(+)
MMRRSTLKDMLMRTGSTRDVSKSAAGSGGADGAAGGSEGGGEESTGASGGAASSAAAAAAADPAAATADGGKASSSSSDPVSGGFPPGVDMQGFLSKKGNLQWKARWFELHGNVLYYYKSKEDNTVRGMLELDQSSTVAALGGDGKALQVIVAGGRALKVSAETEAECELWKLHIRSAIESLGSIQKITVNNQSFEIDKRYSVNRKIGAGAYGMVVSAVDEKTGKRVAIKKVKGAFDDTTDAKRILREIRLMRVMNHSNILSLVNIIKPISLEHFEDVYIITELMSTDLQQIIFSKTPLNEDQTQWILYQCLCGLQYLHSASILHRDLKPSNLLVDIETCDVRICDFGLSRGEVNGGTKTDYVVTRWYRAPEIMLAYTHYDYAIDLWSMGCIFGELLSRRPLLPGKDYIDQLKLIVKLVGSPSEDDLWFVTNRNAKNFISMLPHSEAQDFKAKFPSAPDSAIDLLTRLLTLDPAKRIDVGHAIEHPYLEAVREPRLESLAGFKVDASDVEATQLKKTHLQRKMFEEICSFHDDMKKRPPEPVVAPVEGAAEDAQS